MTGDRPGFFAAGLLRALTVLTYSLCPRVERALEAFPTLTGAQNTLPFFPRSIMGDLCFVKSTFGNGEGEPRALRPDLAFSSDVGCVILSKSLHISEPVRPLLRCTEILSRGLASSPRRPFLAVRPALGLRVAAEGTTPLRWPSRKS